ncbi:unnamed protein product [Amoebophrya sp. A25]|nr:unnamed protein product [Amoebophrya sp. A25]|eukprot:GSA25T00017035001.1
MPFRFFPSSSSLVFSFSPLHLRRALLFLGSSTSSPPSEEEQSITSNPALVVPASRSTTSPSTPEPSSTTASFLRSFENRLGLNLDCSGFVPSATATGVAVLILQVYCFLLLATNRSNLQKGDLDRQELLRHLDYYYGDEDERDPGAALDDEESNIRRISGRSIMDREGDHVDLEGVDGNDRGALEVAERRQLLLLRPRLSSRIGSRIDSSSSSSDEEDEEGNYSSSSVASSRRSSRDQRTRSRKRSRRGKDSEQQQQVFHIRDPPPARGRPRTTLGGRPSVPPSLARSSSGPARTKKARKMHQIEIPPATHDPSAPIEDRDRPSQGPPTRASEYYTDASI